MNARTRLPGGRIVTLANEEQAHLNAERAHIGCAPWMMDSRNYERAVAQASTGGVSLGKDSMQAGATPVGPDARRHL